MALSRLELQRYSRHILLKEVGGPGQAKLKAARVLVVGAGGLGSPVLMYLAAAGVGRLGIVDHDVVSLSNLQRQVIHTTERVGMPKTDSAAVTVRGINPHVEVNRHQLRIDAHNALELIRDYDLIVDGSDNFPTRYLLSDACFLAAKTLVTAAVGQFDGQVATFKPHERRKDGSPQPSYRCLFPEEPPPGLLPSCEEAGILGALTGIVGSLQAIEVLKELLGIGESLAGKLLMYDALAARTYVSEIKWDPKNPLNGERPSIKDLSHLA
jgi:molybdopterin-synthase adenylyltransferase